MLHSATAVPNTSRLNPEAFYMGINESVHLTLLHVVVFFSSPGGNEDLFLH